MPVRRVPTATVIAHIREGEEIRRRPETLAVEEPLELRLRGAGPEGSEQITLSVTMRTPGHDFELAAGMLLGEGIVRARSDIAEIAYCLGGAGLEQRYNVVTVNLAGEPWRCPIERHVVTSSACGICGSSSIEAALSLGDPCLGPGPVVPASLLSRLPDLLREGQDGFARTGALHGAALVDAGGVVLGCREDVGRHNAVDKLLGRAFLDGEVPLADRLLVVSSRVSFEIVQKALRAGVGFVAGVSAATSLAVKLAGESGMTLVGFLRGDRAVIYTGAERIRSRD